MARRGRKGPTISTTLHMAKILGKAMQRALLLPPLVLLLLMCFWAASTLLPMSVLHVCVYARRLNAYCVSASTRIMPGLGVDPQLLTSENPPAAVAAPLPRKEPHSPVADNSNADAGAREFDNNKKNEKKNSGPLGIGEDAEFAQREAERQIEAIRAGSMPRMTPTIGPAGESCRGRGIYVYSLPSKFNADLVEQCGSLIPWMSLCDYLSNGGMGRPIQSADGRWHRWHRTHQYSLEVVFHARIAKHPCLVSNPEGADLFYIPYYAGLDVLRWHFRPNVSNERRDALGAELLNYLEGQPWWKRRGGRDHVLVLGKISWDFRRFRDTDLWGSRLLVFPQMQALTKLLIERHPWHMNEIAVPHPTFFHPRSDEDIRRWQSQIGDSQRVSLVSFAGAARPNSTESIRSILIRQCLDRPEICSFLDCNSGDCSRPESTIDLFVRSEFCLQPPGDSPTRRSVFDSLIAGCIPVLFDPFTAYYQYPWHLPADRDSYSVFISQVEVRGRRVDVVDALQRIPVERRKEMRRSIIYEIMPGLIYGDPDATFREFQDAFTISVDNLLWRVAQGTREKNISFPGANNK